MASIHIASALQVQLMNEGSVVFDTVVTPVLHPCMLRVPNDREQLTAWWAGIMSSMVGAMSATIGEKATQQLCDEMYERAKDFAADQAKARS